MKFLAKQRADARHRWYSTRNEDPRLLCSRARAAEVGDSDGTDTDDVPKNDQTAGDPEEDDSSEIDGRSGDAESACNVIAVPL